MYRRRNQRVQQGIPVVPPKQEHPQEKPQEQPKQKQEEPVIKAAIAAQRKGTVHNKYCPMINVLRGIDYFGANGANQHYVSFETMVDILLSKGYLNGKISTYTQQYYDDKEGADKPNVPASTSNTWSEIYTNTTSYKRDMLCAGDVLYAHDDHKTVAFLVNTVYKSSADSESDSTLDINPPIGMEQAPVDDGLGVVLSTLVDCNGTVYPFANGVTLRQLVEYQSQQGQTCLVSKTTDEKLRKLVPTNMSTHAGTNPDATGDNPTFTAKVGGPEDDEEVKDYTPAYENLATYDQNGASFQMNTSIADGWLIYMYSTKTEAEAGDNYYASIVADVIRTGAIMITPLGKGNSISLGGGVLTFPYIAEGAGSAKFSYTGNCEGFASEPLNSEKYQINYGDTKAIRSFNVTESSIYTFTCFTIGQPQQPNPEEPEPETPGK